MRRSLPVLLSVLFSISCGDGDSTGAGGSTSSGGGGAPISGVGPGATSSSSKSGASTSNGGTTQASSGSGTGGAGGGETACPGAKPDETNTGVPPGVTLTVVDDDVTVDEDGTVIDAQDIHGFLRIQASHVTVKRSIVRGHATDATTAIIRIDSGSDILIEDVEVAAAEPSVDVDGVWGSGFTGRRLNIHGGVDGMKLDSDSTVECSYIHDMAYFDHDPNQGGGATHNDAIQILSGTTIHIVGNQLLSTDDQNAAIQITQDFGMVGDVHIEKNWADGGGCTFNISHKGESSLTDIFSTDNRFGRNSFFDCPILKSTQTTLTSNGDVFDDDDSAVPIQTHD